MWIVVRYLTSPKDPALVGSDDMVFAADVVDIKEAACGD